VTDTPDVEAVCLGDGGVINGARRGAVVVDHSTISPAGTRKIAAKLAERGVQFLDAPVSGGDVGAKNATLSIMVGGEPEAFARVEPTQPLRSHSLLHINVARGDTAAVTRCLQQGIPIDLVAGDGLAPLHWSLAEKSGKCLELLLDSGSPVDVRSDEGSTALMLAVQARRLDQARLLLDRGADANAADARGFSSLHRAAEMGQLEIAKLLITRGASPHAVAGEHTPLSLARSRGEKELESLLASAN